jgi:hypothetical protein
LLFTFASIMPPKRRAAAAAVNHSEQAAKKIIKQDEQAAKNLPPEQELIPLKRIEQNAGYLDRYCRWIHQHSLSYKEAYGEDCFFSGRGLVMRKRGDYDKALLNLRIFQDYLLAHVALDLKARIILECERYTADWLKQFCAAIGLPLSAQSVYALGKDTSNLAGLEALFEALEARNKQQVNSWIQRAQGTASSNVRPLALTRAQISTLCEASTAYTVASAWKAWLHDLCSDSEDRPVHQLALRACEFWGIDETQLHTELLPPMQMPQEPSLRAAMLDRDNGTLDFPRLMVRLVDA